MAGDNNGDQTTTATATDFALPGDDDLSSFDTPAEPTPEADDAQPEAPEPPDSPEAQAEPTDAADGKDTPEPTPKPHDPNKGLQKVQQDLSAYRRQNDDRLDQVQTQIGEIGAQVKSVLEAIQRQGGNATPSQEQKLEEAGDELADLEAIAKDLDKADEYDSLNAVQAKKLIDTLRKVLSKPAAAGETGLKLDELDQHLEKVLTQREQARRQAEQQRRQAVEAFRTEFAEQHPQVADQFEALARQAHTDVDDRFGDRNLTPEQRQVALEMAFDARVAAAEQAATPSPSPAKKKPAATPPRSPEGTQTTVPGASASPTPGDKDWVLPGSPNSGMTMADL